MNSRPLLSAVVGVNSRSRMNGEIGYPLFIMCMIIALKFVRDPTVVGGAVLAILTILLIVLGLVKSHTREPIVASVK